MFLVPDADTWGGYNMMNPAYVVFLLLCFLLGPSITFVHFFGDKELSPNTVWFGGLLLGLFFASVWHIVV